MITEKDAIRYLVRQGYKELHQLLDGRPLDRSMHDCGMIWQARISHRRMQAAARLVYGVTNRRLE